MSAQTLIRTDFGGVWAPVTNNPRGSGELPRSWADNSSWADLRIRHERREEAGTSFLRTSVSELVSGWGQLQHPLPRITETAYYRLRLRARSPNDLSATAGIRRTGQPYNYPWQVTLVPGVTWRDYTFYARLAPADYDVGFYLAINGAGSFELASFELQRMSEAQLLEELTREAEGAPKNLFRNTRFPLGLPAGWVLDRENSDEDVVQFDVNGPALQISSSRPWVLYSEPIAAPKPRTPYTLSFTARGSAAVRLAVVADGSVIASRNFRASPENQRFALSFTSPLLGRAQALRIEATGELLIEDFQAEEGATASSFSPPACELHFAAPNSIRSVFDGEPLVLRYTTLGEDLCRKVQLRVQDLAGGALEISSEGLSGAITLPEAFGAYRVEGWVQDAAGARVSAYQEMTLFRLRRPRYWMRDAPQSPFGVHTNATTRHILMAKAAGINWTRLHDAGLQYIGWYHVERRPGEWTFFDDDLRRYRQYGMKILGSLSTAPEWASYFDRARNSYFDRFYQPRDLEPFANYVRSVTARYQDAIDAWDVWNEPWNAGWWAVRYDDAAGRYVTSTEPEADYAKLQQRAAEAAKEVDQRLMVLGVNSTTGATGTAWTRGVAAAGGLAAADVYTYHQYSLEPMGFENDAVERGFRDAMQPALQQGTLARPVWMTEGSPLYGLMGAGFYRRVLPFADYESYVQTSDRLVRFVVSLLGQGVEKVFLYSMHSHDSLAGAENPWRVLVSRDGQLHPNAAAHSAMAWLLEDKRFVRRFALPGGTTAYVFEGAEGSVAVLAPPAGADVDQPLPPLLHLDLYGNAYDPGGPFRRAVSYLVHDGDAASLARLLAPQP